MSLLARWVLASARRAAWAPLVVFGLHVAISRTGLYRSFGPTDWFMHFFGGIAICHFAAHALVVAGELGLLGAPSRLALRTLNFFAVAFAAIVWEFAEYASDHLFLTRAQGDVEDTLSDMALGLAGGLVYLVLTRARAERAP